jgi:hypothetical protein
MEIWRKGVLVGWSGGAWANGCAGARERGSRGAGAWVLGSSGEVKDAYLKKRDPLTKFILGVVEGVGMTL